MKKQTKSNRQKQILFISQIILVVIFGVSGLTEDVLAQQEENVEFGGVYDCPNNSVRNFKVLNCGNNGWCEVFFVNNSPDGGYKDELKKSKIQELLAGGNCTLNGQKTTTKKNNEENTNVGGTAVRNNQAENKENQNRRFKVGDRVLASPMAMSDEEYFEKCTVIKDYMETEGYDTYQVLCDDPKGGKGTKANVKVPFIKAWANAELPPETPGCPFNEPPGTVSRTSNPSAGLFQRVIYERKRETSNGRKVGITFQVFQMDKPYKNVVTSVPGHGAQLKFDSAPLGATIYPLKTKYLFCDQYTDSTIRWLVESRFACFKDKNGDWVCPVDSVPKYLEQIYLPNK